MTTAPTLPRWSLAVPPFALLVLLISYGRDLGPVLIALVCVGLGVAVTAAVHHAEVVAHRVGEPFGTLILAIAVTVIEVALIVTLMVSGGEKAASLARDTVFAAIMITTNGIVGLALLVGSLRHRVQEFRAHASGGALAVITAMVTLSLVLPTFTLSTAGPTYSGSQLAFAGVASLVLYGVFVFVQTVRHRDYFLPKTSLTEDDHAEAPTSRTAISSLVLLLACLVAVVGLAKTVSPTLEAAVESAGAPVSFVGVVIALLVLLPETVAAVRASLRNRLQVSLNLALGSALASIGLTIPAIAIASIWLTGPLTLGLGPKELVLLVLTVLVSMLTLVTGRATLLQGTVHLTLFSAFLFLAVTP
ncbi:calcium:proton antiporter [Actinokineospora globicatena]|uniref:Ionic transporter y4hA n=1 Tax=Actinokineospora globicatena TaxID=103729 RepID=A0A9W6VAV1_9PSEU|nr:ionic transporter y4hA [Actinokineospora globicatena]MCP2301621.1 Ca2+:H+ antiporter [Actinokineospora globicatena]GLW76725.1 ionic transporter y4hA [Actinokineospora globicatena]GLW83558.1 ionic transporter y4hA [Actinokineospora globicatena]GLW92496.1 ionic transporter y4hA [Actinokineospora globicatena]